MSTLKGKASPNFGTAANTDQETSIPLSSLAPHAQFLLEKALHLATAPLFTLNPSGNLEDLTILKQLIEL